MRHRNAKNNMPAVAPQEKKVPRMHGGVPRPAHHGQIRRQYGERNESRFDSRPQIGQKRRQEYRPRREPRFDSRSDLPQIGHKRRQEYRPRREPRFDSRPDLPQMDQKRKQEYRPRKEPRFDYHHESPQIVQKRKKECRPRKEPRFESPLIAEERKRQEKREKWRRYRNKCKERRQAKRQVAEQAQTDLITTFNEQLKDVFQNEALMELPSEAMEKMKSATVNMLIAETAGPTAGTSSEQVMREMPDISVKQPQTMRRQLKMLSSCIKGRRYHPYFPPDVPDYDEPHY